MGAAEKSHSGDEAKNIAWTIIILLLTISACAAHLCDSLHQYYPPSVSIFLITLSVRSFSPVPTLNFSFISFKSLLSILTSPETE